MARREQKPEPVHADGAPEWMVTFSDCMTLLLTFFVLLLSFSSFDEKVFWNLRVMYSDGLSSISPISLSNRDAFEPEVDRINAAQQLERGSEKPTPENENKDAAIREKPLVNLEQGRVILIPSRNIFWGKGQMISSSGQKSLAVLAAFLGKVTSRVVISEHGGEEESGMEDYGLSRAWAVSEHLTGTHGLPREQFSLSAASTLPPDGLSVGEQGSSGVETDRVVEVVLLDRSIHD